MASKKSDTVSLSTNELESLLREAYNAGYNYSYAPSEDGDWEPPTEDEYVAGALSALK